MTPLMASFAAAGFFSLLGWWRYNPIAMLCAAGCSFVTFYQWGNTYSNNYGYGVALMFFVYALACLAYGIRLMFWNKDADDET